MLTVRKNLFLKEFVIGMIFLCVGIIDMAIDIDLISDIFVYFNIFLLAIMILLASFISFKIKKGQVESDDELSLRNRGMASELMVNGMILLFLIISLLISILNVTIIITNNILFIFLGVFQIGNYLIFRYLETEE